MAANLLASVNSYCCFHRSRGSAFVPCLIMLVSVDARGHLKEKISCKQHLYFSGVALFCP